MYQPSVSLRLAQLAKKRKYRPSSDSIAELIRVSVWISFQEALVVCFAPLFRTRHLSYTATTPKNFIDSQKRIFLKKLFPDTG